MKDFQTSIEVSTYAQVKAMLISGVFHITCNYNRIFHSSDELVSLTITGHSDSKQKHTLYTLKDLKSLESKIILIRDSWFSTANEQCLEGVVKARYSASIYSDTLLLEKLSSEEIEEFLDVRLHIIIQYAST